MKNKKNISETERIYVKILQNYYGTRATETKTLLKKVEIWEEKTPKTLKQGIVILAKKFGMPGKTFVKTYKKLEYLIHSSLFESGYSMGEYRTIMINGKRFIFTDCYVRKYLGRNNGNERYDNVILNLTKKQAIELKNIEGNWKYYGKWIYTLKKVYETPDSKKIKIMWIRG